MKKSKRQKLDFALSTASCDHSCCYLWRTGTHRALGAWGRARQSGAVCLGSWCHLPGAKAQGPWSSQTKCPHHLPGAKTQGLGLLNFQEVPPLAFSSLIVWGSKLANAVSDNCPFSSAHGPQSWSCDHCSHPIKLLEPWMREESQHQFLFKTRTMSFKQLNSEPFTQFLV